MIKGEEAERLLKRIRATTDVLNEHFKSLLDLSRFDAGGVEVEPSDFDIDNLLQSIVDEFRPEAESKGLCLSLSTESWLVHSDGLLVERVVRNLLTNAIRYTQKGSVAVIADRAGDRITLTVADTGPGIPEDQQANIFDEFVQLNNPGRRREQGVGLGLAIVRRIDAMLGLRLRLISRMGLGSRFEFELPLSSPRQDKRPVPAVLLPQPQSDPRTLPPGLLIWVVEDDAMVAEALCIQLQTWGYETRLATTREQLTAYQADTGRWPDLALIDDMLGEKESGLDIAHWLKRYISVDRIVMVTGNIMPDRLAEIADSGFELVHKPMPPQRLEELLVSAGSSVTAH